MRLPPALPPSSEEAPSPSRARFCCSDSLRAWRWRAAWGVGSERRVLLYESNTVARHVDVNSPTLTTYTPIPSPNALCRPSTRVPEEEQLLQGEGGP